MFFFWQMEFGKLSSHLANSAQICQISAYKFGIMMLMKLKGEFCAPMSIRLANNVRGQFHQQFCQTFFSQTRSEAFFSKWRLANGTQIWQMVHKIQLVNEDFDIAQFLVKLSVIFSAKSRVPESFRKFGEIHSRGQYHQLFMRCF